MYEALKGKHLPRWFGWNIFIFVIVMKSDGANCQHVKDAVMIIISMGNYLVLSASTGDINLYCTVRHRL